MHANVEETQGKRHNYLLCLGVGQTRKTKNWRMTALKVSIIHQILLN